MTIDIENKMQALGKTAKQASTIMRSATTKQKNTALLNIASELENNKAAIMTANAIDLDNAKNNNLSSALLDRLEINTKVFQGMIAGLHQVAALPDVVGQIENMNQQPSGIKVGKMRVPLGVIAIIYESRPNVTIEASSLCLKSGNSCILRGGSEAFHSNQQLAKIIHAGIAQTDLPTQAVSVLDITDRKAVDSMVTMSDYIDVVIPRGGKSLIQHISNKATVSVIKHLDGVCHVYIDSEADKDKAIAIAINSKTHRFGVCNAMETLLIHEKIATDVLPELLKQLLAKQVAIKCCAKTMALINDKDNNNIELATEQDWHTEYLAPILSIKLVADMDEAIAHINLYGSQHTDAIVSQDYSKTQKFLAQVDSSSVVVNASTRFADGFEYGLGAEIGISTDKIHVRGPVGLAGLTSQKYIVLGDGNIRS